MNFEELFGDDRAVSPVIGVILMVAITVILAAVIGSFVLGLGNSVQQSAPNANFQFDFANPGSGYDVTATHTGGDTIPTEESLNLTVGPDSNSTWTGSGGISAGDSARINNTDNSTARVIWSSATGDSSQVLAEENVPS